MEESRRQVRFAMLFDVYGLERPAYSHRQPFCAHYGSVEAVRGLGLRSETCGEKRAVKGRGMAREGLCNERIRGARAAAREVV